MRSYARRVCARGHKLVHMHPNHFLIIWSVGQKVNSSMAFAKSKKQATKAQPPKILSKSMQRKRTL